MNYQETLDYLYNQLPVFHRIGKAAYKANLDNTVALDRYFGSPHKKFISIHIAGTNGKGSVSHMLASVLHEAGLRTGLYTSPHLRDYRERIRINGEKIAEERVTSFVADNIGILNDLKPSFFEMSVAMAFDHFAREKVDVAVIETGLGGRLDSTNIIYPILSVITNIGYDHMDLLGNTLEKIAGEKAGIIKKNIPVIIGETNPETEEVFISKAAECGSKIIFADRLYSCSLDETGDSWERRGFTLTNKTTAGQTTGFTGLMGDYQEKNIPVVVMACDIIGQKLGVESKHVAKGIENVIKNTDLRGRWQAIGRNPLVVCDTGHNREGLLWVIRQLMRIRKGEIHFVIGFVNDKDLSLVLPLFPSGARYYFTRASVPRALDQDILREKASAYGLTGLSFEKTCDALTAARENASVSDIIFIGGSTFVVAEVI